MGISGEMKIIQKYWGQPDIEDDLVGEQDQFRNIVLP